MNSIHFMTIAKCLIDICVHIIDLHFNVFSKTMLQSSTTFVVLNLYAYEIERIIYNKLTSYLLVSLY